MAEAITHFEDDGQVHISLYHRNINTPKLGWDCSTDCILIANITRIQVKSVLFYINYKMSLVSIENCAKTNNNFQMIYVGWICQLDSEGIQADDSESTIKILPVVDLS
ncbi:hypothetical protein OCU04_008272 [Sclerotinia nivalis]|uniref:Uncharacterized protein n=1 Tax=Sclerotinia nivalis TaxID=352851 RepID=A0A9X0ALC7_9HELO|nr:hypothetical protein OCU04_008272 [Sclerotinia nivalis]